MVVSNQSSGASSSRKFIPAQWYNILGQFIGWDGKEMDGGTLIKPVDDKISFGWMVRATVSRVELSRVRCISSCQLCQCRATQNYENKVHALMYTILDFRLKLNCFQLSYRNGFSQLIIYLGSYQSSGIMKPKWFSSMPLYDNNHPTNIADIPIMTRYCCVNWPTSIFWSLLTESFHPAPVPRYCWSMLQGAPNLYWAKPMWERWN